MPVRIPTKMQPPKKDPHAAAKAAVKKFEQERAHLVDMNDDFEAKHPEAVASLAVIREQEDKVGEAMKHAKELLRALGEDAQIGPFKVKIPHSTPGYASGLILQLMVKLPDPDAGAVLKRLVDTGAVKDLKVDSEVTRIVIKSEDVLAQTFEGAWRESEPLDPRVTGP